MSFKVGDSCTSLGTCGLVKSRSVYLRVIYTGYMRMFSRQDFWRSCIILRHEKWNFIHPAGENAVLIASVNIFFSSADFCHITSVFIRNQMWSCRLYEVRLTDLLIVNSACCYAASFWERNPHPSVMCSLTLSRSITTFDESHSSLLVLRSLEFDLILRQVFMYIQFILN